VVDREWRVTAARRRMAADMPETSPATRNGALVHGLECRHDLREAKEHANSPRGLNRRVRRQEGRSATSGGRRCSGLRRDKARNFRARERERRGGAGREEARARFYRVEGGEREVQQGGGVELR
jgi:hypothetical protein